MRDVLYDSIVQITSGALRAAALALTLLAVALFTLGWQVPAWILVLALVVAIGLMYLTKRVASREGNELRPRLGAAEDKLDRHDSYGTNICSIMDNFQRVLAGDIPGVTVPEFIERGILTAGRDVMQENGHASDLRMSVLLAKDGHFSMWKASGHNIQSQTKYRQPIEKTVSRIAYEKKGIQRPPMQRPAGQAQVLAEPKARPRLLRRVSPKAAPEGGVGSGALPEENGASDD